MDPVNGPALIRKRDGRLVEFDLARLAGSVARAASEARKEQASEFGGEIAKAVAHFLVRQGRKMPRSGEVREMVERVLSDAGHAEVCGRYREHAQREATFLWSLRVAPSPRSHGWAGGPWERERLARSLNAAGLPPGAACEIARAVERKLGALGEGSVSPGVVHELARFEAERRGLDSARYACRRVAVAADPEAAGDERTFARTAAAARRGAVEHSREIREAIDAGLLSVLAPLPRSSREAWAPSGDASPAAWAADAARLCAELSKAARDRKEIRIRGLEDELSRRGTQWLDGIFRSLASAREGAGEELFARIEMRAGGAGAARRVLRRWAASESPPGRDACRCAVLTGPAAEPDVAGLVLADLDMQDSRFVRLAWDAGAEALSDDAEPVAADLGRALAAQLPAALNEARSIGRLAARCHAERAERAPGGRPFGRYPVYAAGLDECLARCGISADAAGAPPWCDSKRARAWVDLLAEVAAGIREGAEASGLPFACAGVLRAASPGPDAGEGADGWFDRQLFRVEPRADDLWAAAEFRRAAADAGVRLPLAFPHAAGAADSAEWTMFLSRVRDVLEPSWIALAGGGRPGEVRRIFECLRRETERHPLLTPAARRE